MEANNILTNEEVLEATEEIATCGSKKGVKIAAGIGVSVFVGIIAYKYVVKPIVAKIKAKKELKEAQTDSETISNEKIVDQHEGRYL